MVSRLRELPPYMHQSWRVNWDWSGTEPMNCFRAKGPRLTRQDRNGHKIHTTSVNQATLPTEGIYNISAELTQLLPFLSNTDS